MADVVLFHHAQGLTPGVERFADRLRAEGHGVTVPDLFEGRMFASVEEGVAHAQAIGTDLIVERGRAAAEALPDAVVYAGFSLGVIPAQMLAQTRPGARGALLFHACVPPSEFGAWPAGVPAQVHAMESDPWFAEDLQAARDLVAAVPTAELIRVTPTSSPTTASPPTTKPRRPS